MEAEREKVRWRIFMLMEVTDKDKSVNASNQKTSKRK